MDEGEEGEEGGEPFGWIEAAIRCQHFYGGNPAGWLTDVPVGLIRAYVKMLPRLHAEDMLDHRTAVALGTGSLKDGEAVTRNLMSVAKGEGRPRSSRPSPAALAMMGIKVERVKVNG